MSQDNYGNYQVELEPSAVTPGNSISGGNFLVGSGAPDDSLGSDGMAYGDEDTGDIYTKSGGTWTIFTSGGGAANGMGVVDPGGVVTPAAIGQFYTNTVTPSLWQATGLTSADWTLRWI